ncbi:hypothetical protein [Pseudorhodoferax sp. Leaf274]|uniref:hypothetical protein n=1 Tax=Pseudorhodoferax sp. Leaf274 TaxID=1736318 RepID=UPI000702A1C5|nr:hypothetical protein [Pseudorhodoferax sp. Leaf274]KQP45064.1 hypothetical protein ASF44_26645 [Pseudorhodoferax sp. Leaf274]
MKASTALTSLVAAASLVGAIGLAYAQTSGGTYQTPQQAQMGSVDGTPNNNSNMNNATTQMPQAMPAPMQATPDMNAQPQLPPQADRN